MSHFAGLCHLKTLPYAIKEWNKSDPEVRNAETFASFRKMFLNFIKPTRNSTYKIYDLLGTKLTRLRLGFTISPNTNLDINLLTH